LLFRRRKKNIVGGGLEHEFHGMPKNPTHEFFEKQVSRTSQKRTVGRSLTGSVTRKKREFHGTPFLWLERVDRAAGKVLFLVLLLLHLCISCSGLFFCCYADTAV
jgi:hypothetical protein